MAVRGGADSDESDLTDDWDQPGFCVEDATLALEDHGRVVGYATVVQEYADITVEPVRDDLLDELLAWVEGHPQTLEHDVPDPDPDVAQTAVVQRRG